MNIDAVAKQVFNVTEDIVISRSFELKGKTEMAQMDDPGAQNDSTADEKEPEDADLGDDEDWDDVDWEDGEVRIFVFLTFLEFCGAE